MMDKVVTRAKAQSRIKRNAFQAADLFQRSRGLLIALLFIAAFVVRLYHIDAPPLNFHATRQYRSLIISRGFYFQMANPVPAWVKSVALTSQQRQGILEPPIMEGIVAAGYVLLGGERLWLPHLLSTLFWLIGGVFLYMLARSTADVGAAVVAVVFYLFLPFAVVASRSFQPDPLMIMLLLACLWAIWHYYQARTNEAPTTARLVTATIFSALAFMVKPGSLFVLAGAFLALAVFQDGIWRGLLNKNVFLFLFFVVMPTLAVYAYGAITRTFLIGEAEKTVIPSLLLTPFFWLGWIGNISSTVGYIAFFAALLGVFIFRPGAPRAFLVGLWIGYVAFCLTLNYNVATHDYYQLMLVPIAALSLAPLVMIVLRQALAQHPEWYWRSALGGILLAALAITLASSVVKLNEGSGDAAKQVQIEANIGELVNHSTQTIFLADDYGVSLEYHGLMSGKPWPLSSDLEWERLTRAEGQSAAERFQTLFASESPDYFIVLDRSEFQKQPDLQAFLNENYPILAQNDDYLIFNLRHRKS